MVYILLANGVEPMEAIVPYDILRRGGVEAAFVGVNGKTIETAHNVTLQAHCTLEEMDEAAMEMIVVPGGIGGVTVIRGDAAALGAVKRAWENGKLVAAICAGPMVLADLGISEGKVVTCYPTCAEQMRGAKYTPAVVQEDGRLITGQAPGAAEAFGFRLLAALKGEDAAKEVAAGMLSRN